MRSLLVLCLAFLIPASLYAQTLTPASTSAPSSVTLSGAALAPHVCQPPQRKLVRGASGSDVADLQLYLARNANIYPEGQASGYFGPATERAIQRWQKIFGLVSSGSPSSTGWGAVGTRTLAALASAWNCDSQVTIGWFVGAPTTGSSQSIFFSAQALSPHPLGPAFAIDFGDGATGVATVASSVCTGLAGSCSSILSGNHDYAPGTYTAKLYAITTLHNCSAAQPGLPATCTTSVEKILVGQTSVIAGATLPTTVPTTPQTPSVVTGPAPVISFTQPVANTKVIQGGAVSIAWTTQYAPTQSTMTLTLKDAFSGSILGSIVTGKSASGAYFWTLPAAQSSSCSGSSLDCLAQLATTCTGPLCSIPDGAYRIHAELRANGVIAASGDSAPFAIGTGGIALLPNVPPLATSSVSSVPAGAAGGSTASAPSTSGSGPQCTYNGVGYGDGISLTVSCADVTLPGKSCGSSNGLGLTCKSGQWLTASGTVASIPGASISSPSASTSCKTPWQSVLVGNQQQIPYEPYFTGGTYSGQTPIPLMQCSNGRWQKCSWIGDSCHSYTQL